MSLAMQCFYLAGFIEAWGRGYEKIRDAFKAESLKMPHNALHFAA